VSRLRILAYEHTSNFLVLSLYKNFRKKIYECQVENTNIALELKEGLVCKKKAEALSLGPGTFWLVPKYLDVKLYKHPAVLRTRS